MLHSFHFNLIFKTKQVKFKDFTSIQLTVFNLVLTQYVFFSNDFEVELIISLNSKSCIFLFFYFADSISMYLWLFFKQAKDYHKFIALSS